MAAEKRGWDLSNYRFHNPESRNWRGVMIGVSRKTPRSRRSRSPVTIRSAQAASAHSRIRSSSGSRHTLTGSWGPTSRQKLFRERYNTYLDDGVGDTEFDGALDSEVQNLADAPAELEDGYKDVGIGDNAQTH